MNCLRLIIEYFGITVPQIDYKTKKLDKYHHLCTAQNEFKSYCSNSKQRLITENKNMELIRK